MRRSLPRDRATVGRARSERPDRTFWPAGSVEMSESTRWESFKIDSGQLIEQVKRLIHEGNVRRVVVKQDGRIVAEFPLTIGVVGAALAPVLAAVGTLAALLAECTIEVERVEPAREESPEADGSAGTPSHDG